MQPGAQFIAPERYGDIQYSFNSDGYRDVDHSQTVHQKRIVLLGDSVTFGLGVEQDRIYAARLQSALDLRYGDGIYDVVNLAIFAYHTRNELEALQEDGLAYRPALIILQFYMNDFAIPKSTPEADPEIPLGSRLVALKNRLLYSSNLYRRLHQAVAAATFALFHDFRRQVLPGSLNDSEPRDKLRYLASIPDDAQVDAFTAIAEIHRIAMEHGAHFLVMITPDEVQLINDRYDAINQRITSFCRRRGIPYLDLLPILRRHPEPLKLFLDGVHLTPLGHETVAESLLTELNRRGLLAPPRAFQTTPGGNAGAENPVR